MDYRGTVIEESLADHSILDRITILATKVEPVTPRHQTPWLKQWTLQTVLIAKEQAGQIAGELSKSLHYSHKGAWYADFKNPEFHYIIFKDKIFKIRRTDAQGYQQAKQYGMDLGIPEYQVDFSPNID